MPQTDNPTGSTYNQQSFIGGMSLLGEDTELQPNQYRLGINVRNRYGSLDLVPSSYKDIAAPPGKKQAIVTFGEYVIAFISGFAFYRHYKSYNWITIDGFKMDSNAPRYWTEAIPVAQTNYYRVAASITVGDGTFANSLGAVSSNIISGAAAGNLPGLLVQDNINQPQFIFLSSNNFPVCRTTQKYEEWKIVFTDNTNTVVAEIDGVTQDFREYVPIGNAMAYVDGILYIASQDGTQLLRSVEGRPLDFVVAVSNSLASDTDNPPLTQLPAGDAFDTAYSVGVGGITALRALPDNSLFVAASNANFSVSKNTSNIATKLFGEWTFVRTFLFNANCLSDRAILDSIGDTKFIDLYGIRSFNAVVQLHNEGRNSPFSANIQAIFGTDRNPIVQDAQYAASIIFNNYELYAVNTILGAAIAVYDTINNCWVGFDVSQTEGKRIKQFAKIELAIQALFCITEDDQIYQLYVGPTVDEAFVRTVGICANVLFMNQNIKVTNPKNEIKPIMIRVINNGITQDCSITMTNYVNNRISDGPTKQNIAYREPATVDGGNYILPDVNTMLANRLFSVPNAKQGWKMFVTFTWTSGYLSQFSVDCNDLTPMNPSNSQ